MNRLLIPPVWFALAALGMLALHRVLPGPRLVPESWWLAALVPLLPGALLAASAARLFLQADTPIEPWKTPRRLVVRGPYRLTRNPMYLGLTLFLSALALWLGSTSPWLLLPAFMAIITWRFIHREERCLQALFGAAYDAYKARVRRWI